MNHRDAAYNGMCQAMTQSSVCAGMCRAFGSSFSREPLSYLFSFRVSTVARTQPAELMMSWGTDGSCCHLTSRIAHLYGAGFNDLLQNGTDSPARTGLFQVNYIPFLLLWWKSCRGVCYCSLSPFECKEIVMERFMYITWSVCVRQGVLL